MVLRSFANPSTVGIYVAVVTIFLKAIFRTTLNVRGRLHAGLYLGAVR